MRTARLLRGADRALKNTSDSTFDRVAASARVRVAARRADKVDEAERWINERKRAQ